MRGILQQTIRLFGNNPKKLFLIDSLGALLTAVSLFFVLFNLDEHFGVPGHVLTTLALIATCFSVYSVMCFLFVKKNFMFYLRIIGSANLIYCLLILSLLYFFILNLPRLLGLIF